MRIVASKKGDGTIEKELFSPESLKQNGVALTNGYASLPPSLPSLSISLRFLVLFHFHFLLSIHHADPFFDCPTSPPPHLTRRRLSMNRRTIIAIAGGMTSGILGLTGLKGGLCYFMYMLLVRSVHSFAPPAIPP